MLKIECIKEKISEAIKYSGKTQTEIANALQIKQQTISEYKNKISLPSIETLALLCEYLDLDANDILCINERKTTTNNIKQTFTFNF